MKKIKGSYLKNIAIVGSLVTGLTMITLKIIAIVKKDHEYDEENRALTEEIQKDSSDRAKDSKTSRFQRRPNIYVKYIKRFIDFTLSFGALIVLSPIYLILSIMIYIDDPGPILFTQKRVGIHKTHFKLHKFRSMKMSTPHDTPTHLLENPEQYITRMGHILRKYSLDELPQIWDIFIGNMSIVGPRPALWNQFDLVAERDRYGANDVRPGLTGWAQINGRDELEIDVKARLDGEYIEQLTKNSLAAMKMDIKCFFGTFSSVAKADGVVEGGTGEMERKQGNEETEDAESTYAKPKKKLLAITNHSYMFWQFRRELMQELQKDYEVVISTPYEGKEDDFKNLGFRLVETEINRRGINPVTDLKLLCFYYKLLKEEKTDMVITYSIKPNIYAGLVCELLKIPYCVNVQGLGTAFQKEPLASVVSMMYRMACKKAKTIFFENEGNAQVFIVRHIVPEDRITVLPGAGVNLEHYYYVPYEKHDQVRFLYLGRIMKEKGMDELFYAIRKLYDNYGDKVHLDLVGFFEDEYKDSVNQLVEDGIATFHGFQPDPRPYYAKTDCVVLPSYHEGMSNVLLEAAATGRCIITSDIPGCREAVLNGKSGFLCEAENKFSLYEAMEKVLLADDNFLDECGKIARDHVTNNFDKNLVIEKTIDNMF